MGAAFGGSEEGTFDVRAQERGSIGEITGSEGWDDLGELLVSHISAVKLDTFQCQHTREAIAISTLTECVHMRIHMV